MSDLRAWNGTLQIMPLHANPFLCFYDLQKSIDIDINGKSTLYAFHSTSCDALHDSHSFLGAIRRHGITSWPSWPRGKGLCLRWSCEAQEHHIPCHVARRSRSEKMCKSAGQESDRKVYRRVNGRDFQETLKRL